MKDPNLFFFLSFLLEKVEAAYSCSLDSNVSLFIEKNCGWKSGILPESSFSVNSFSLSLCFSEILCFPGGLVFGLENWVLRWVYLTGVMV